MCLPDEKKAEEDGDLSCLKKTEREQNRQKTYQDSQRTINTLAELSDDQVLETRLARVLVTRTLYSRTVPEDLRLVTLLQESRPVSRRRR